jgi:hypothetical protein
MKDTSDPRPESLRVDPKSIVVEERVDKHEERRAILERSPHMIGSVEELKEKQLSDGTSLGIIKPKDILDCFLENRPASERADWDRKEAVRMGQHRLFGEQIKPLDFPEVEFAVRWKCRNPNRQEHTMHLLQWGLHELYRKLKQKNDPRVREKVIEKMQSELDESRRDVYLFLGNFRAVMYNFGLMDSYSPPRIADDDRFSLFRTIEEPQD